MEGSMSDEIAIKLTNAINTLCKKLDQNNSDWIKGEEMLNILGKRFSKRTATRHCKNLRESGKIREFKKDGRDYMYSRSEVIKLSKYDSKI